MVDVGYLLGMHFHTTDHAEKKRYLEQLVEREEEFYQQLRNDPNKKSQFEELKNEENVIKNQLPKLEKGLESYQNKESEFSSLEDKIELKVLLEKDISRLSANYKLIEDYINEKNEQTSLDNQIRDLEVKLDLIKYEGMFGENDEPKTLDEELEIHYLFSENKTSPIDEDKSEEQKSDHYVIQTKIDHLKRQKILSERKSSGLEKKINKRLSYLKNYSDETKKTKIDEECKQKKEKHEQLKKEISELITKKKAYEQKVLIATTEIGILKARRDNFYLQNAEILQEKKRFDESVERIVLGSLCLGLIAKDPEIEIKFYRKALTYFGKMQDPERAKIILPLEKQKEVEATLALRYFQNENFSEALQIIAQYKSQKPQSKEDFENRPLSDKIIYKLEYKIKSEQKNGGLYK